MTLQRAGVDAWLEGYLRAWRSDGPDDIRALFTQDARYRAWPEDEWHGHDEIVGMWVKAANSKMEWRFDYSILAVDGDLAVIEGRTWYGPTERDAGETEYANIWAFRLNADGRCSDFREWWMERRG